MIQLLSLLSIFSGLSTGLSAAVPAPPAPTQTIDQTTVTIDSALITIDET